MGEAGARISIPGILNRRKKSKICGQQRAWLAWGLGKRPMEAALCG